MGLQPQNPNHDKIHLMKIYISLPISGLNKDRCKERAERMRKLIEEKGHYAITPFDLCPDSSLPYHTLMARDIEGLMQCDGIMLMAGWSHSRGCSLEWQCAVIYGKKIFKHINQIKTNQS